MTASVMPPSSRAEAVMKKLPEITLAFWVMKVAATTLGETAGDMISQTLELGYFLSTVTLFAIFVVTLVVQLRSSRYHPVFYWTVILSTSMAGTTLSDFMNRDTGNLSAGTTSLGWGPQGLGLGYPTGAAILTSLLIAVFVVWRTTGLTFDISKINTFRGEALFWTAILISNTLGTSMGDFLADSSGLGYLGGAVLITAVLAVLAACTQVRWMPNVLVFWLAFVLTRPLGATVGDFFTKPAAKGGLGLGTYGASAVLLAVLAGFIGYAMVGERRRRAIAVPAATVRTSAPI
ncbi:COG4705 family protein [Actinoplanes awajinensis]|uniref:Membrane-anchored protein n=1 Tax=Actinoplanes awajinensis subsp. mycoplanecinus TaxID=135947 RepID=A0A101JRN2_9ACTN|nr:hypothetical protein [Actinoplanes awajinensis]KUL31726.1 hypothetical protein ADL15_21340 [Actinoplanes awajinensis subsp. mycoplanecinus]